MVETSLNFGITILEPVTAATDLLLSAFCFYFYFKLKLPTKSEHLLKFWRLFFFILGITTFIGTVAHGLRFYMNEMTFRSVWMIMNLSSIGSSFFLLLATIEKVRKEDLVLLRKLHIVAFISTLIVTSITLTFNDFSLIRTYAGAVILMALYWHYATFRQGIPGSGQIAFGLGLSMLSVLVHVLKFSISDYFNFKDLGHVIILISLSFIFMGAMNKTRIATAE